MFQASPKTTKVIAGVTWEQNNICEENNNVDHEASTVNMTRLSLPLDVSLTDHIASLPVPSQAPRVLAEHWHWFKHGKMWKWLSADSDLLLPLEDKKLLGYCDCVVKKYDKVFLLGASHLNYDTTCMNLMCPPTFKKSIEYKWSANVSSLTPDLEAVFKRISQKDFGNGTQKHYAVVVQLGAHDIMFKGLSSIIEELPKFYALLERLYIRELYPSVRLIVVATPALPNLPVGKAHTRNNWVTGVFVHRLRQHMKQLDIPFLDGFSFTLPLYQQTAYWPLIKDECHYARIHGDQCVGHVGIAFTQLLLSQICSDTLIHPRDEL